MMYSRRKKRKPNVLRAAAWAGVGIGALTPLVRRRLALRAPVAIAVSAVAPLGLAIAVPRSKRRDAAIYALQMWAYLGAYESPNDNPEKLMSRVRVDYPIKCDRVLGMGELPTVRLQPPPNPGHLKRRDYALSWVHWLWYLFPHSAVLYTMLKKRRHFSRTASTIAAVYDLGAIVYWLVPTAPPWWAAQEGRMPVVRRIMLEAGERTWGSAWKSLYGFLGGNPVAAMPSLHFATSVMAAKRYAETGPVAGTLGWAYALTLGYGLVYLGEHYVTDLIAGYALAEAIDQLRPAAAPLLTRCADGVKALERRARN